MLTIMKKAKKEERLYKRTLRKGYIIPPTFYLTYYLGREFIEFSDTS